MIHSRLFTLAVVLGLLFGLTSVVAAGDVYNYEISIDGGDTEFFVGNDIPMTITLDFADGEVLAGYSVGICGEAEILTMNEDGEDVVNGETVEDAGFFFHAVTVRDNQLPDDDPDFPLPDDEVFVTGFTIGTALDFGTTLAPNEGDAYEMYLVTWSAIGDAEDIQVTWCTIGEPPVSPTVVLEDLTEVGEDGDLAVISTEVFDILPVALFDYRAEIFTGTYDPVTGDIGGVDCTFTWGEEMGEHDPADHQNHDPPPPDVADTPLEVTVTTVLVTFSVEENADASPTFPTETDGLSMAVLQDGTIFHVCSAQAAGAMADLRGGLGPEFLGVNIHPSGGTQDGWTAGVAFSFAGTASLAFDGDTVVMSANYESVDAANFTFDPPEDAPDVVVDLVFATADNPLGDPVVENSIITQGGDISFDLFNGDLAVSDGSITMVPTPPDLEFIRGDCNDDSIVNIADAIFALNARFQPPGQASPLPGCLEACDANDDGGSFEATDAIFILNYQFLEGPEPPAPFPDCGIEEGAVCDESISCP